MTLRGFRDRAPRALRHLKSDIADGIAVDLDEHLDAVAAQRIVALGAAIRRLQPLEVPRIAVVIEDDLLVELAQIAHCSARRPRTIASSSARSGATLMRPRISAANP